jgi:GNAT superfamily N-acetyltransferase
VRPLDRGDEESDTPSTGSLQVLPVPDAELEEFISTLLAGYEAKGIGARFIEAGHRSPEVQRFAVWSEGRMIATAGMSLHEDVASLGGASTLPEARGHGAQSLLLRYRLQVASQAGCAWAVATAGYGSQSARNMERAGFLVHNRPSRHVPG